MRILGIDPGITGGLAIWDVAKAEAVSIIDVPTIGEAAKERVNAMQLRDWLVSFHPQHAFIERAQAMPDQGASSGFKYGRAVGALEAVVQACDVPLTIIESTAWKRHHNLKGGSKEDSRQRALQLVPTAVKWLDRKMDHGRAESLLIALYGVGLV